MNYENPSVTSEWLNKEFFNMYLVALTQLNKPIKAQELGDLLKLSSQMSAKCVDIVLNDLAVKNSPEATKFWNSVKSGL